MGAASLVLAIGVLLIGARQRWGIPVSDARAGNRPTTLPALSAQTTVRAEWVSRNKARWMHVGAILTAVGVLLVALGFLAEL
jgi:nitrate reductase gamma subunit